MIEQVIKEIWSFNEHHSHQLMEAAELIKNAETVYCVGNGGSSSLMSHLTSDLQNLGIEAVCLTDNTARLTALTNDEGWNHVYRHMIKNRVKPSDLLIVASVHGSAGLSWAGQGWSANLYDLVQLFRDRNAKVLSFVGNNGGMIKPLSTLCLAIKSPDPYIVEGIHSVLAHAVCKEIRETMK